MDETNEYKPTDEELIRNYQELGDLDALDALISRYLEKAYSYFLKHTNSPVDSDDLVQNLFLRLVRIINTSKKINKFKFYFYICCQNTFRDYLRSKKSLSKIKSWDDKSENLNILESFADNGENNLSEIYFSEEHIEKIVKSCIKMFPSKKVQNILLDKLMGYSLKEIAKRNDCPQNTAASIWHRKKQKLFKYILFNLET